MVSNGRANKCYSRDFIFFTYFAIWSDLFAPFIVINQKFEPITFVEATFVGYRIHQYKRIRPSNIWFKICTVIFLFQHKISRTQWESKIISFSSCIWREKVFQFQKKKLVITMECNILLTLSWPDFASKISNNTVSLSIIVLNE